MPQLTDREKIERRLIRALGKVNTEVQSEIIAALGDPPDILQLTQEMWAEWQQRYEAALMGELEQTFVTAADALMQTIGMGVDWTVVNEAAATWARQYTYDLVRGINDRSRQLLQQAVNDFYQSGMTNADLQARIGRMFDARRAELIGITEVTRASVEGERAIVREIEAAGLAMVAIWNTVNDRGVCPICKPRNQKKYGDGWTDYPPSHPGCRCFVNHEPVTPP